jgi:periplasmic divalent cation tolerance protein
MSTDVCLALSTCPDRATALEIAEALVAEDLAACVNLVSGITSVYRWQGETERAEEILLLAKTTAAGYPRLQERIRALHPYEVPEIIAIAVQQGLSEYLDWVKECATSDARRTS